MEIRHGVLGGDGVRWESMRQAIQDDGKRLNLQCFGADGKVMILGLSYAEARTLLKQLEFHLTEGDSPLALLTDLARAWDEATDDNKAEQIEAALGPAHRPPAAPLADPFARQHPAHGEAALLPPAPLPPGGAPAHGAPRAPRALPPITPSQSRPKPER